MSEETRRRLIAALSAYMRAKNPLFREYWNGVINELMQNPTVH
jgi:hypothetical protein